MSRMNAKDFERYSVDELESSIESRLSNGMRSCQDRGGQPEWSAAEEAAAAIRTQSKKIVEAATAPLIKKIAQLEESQARLEYAFGLLQLRQSLETPNEHSSNQPTAVS